MKGKLPRSRSQTLRVFASSPTRASWPFSMPMRFGTAATSPHHNSPTGTISPPSNFISSISFF